MKAEQFEILYNNMEARVLECRKFLENVKTKEDLESLSVKDIKALKDFCDTEVIKQTNILMVDLYHVIGMTDLTVVQLSKFIKLIKEYASYRPDIKAIAKSVLDVYNLPNIPTGTYFKALELGLEVKCSRGNEDEVKYENETVDSYTNKHNMVSGLHASEIEEFDTSGKVLMDKDLAVKNYGCYLEEINNKYYLSIKKTEWDKFIKFYNPIYKSVGGGSFTDTVKNFEKIIYNDGSNDGRSHSLVGAPEIDSDSSFITCTFPEKKVDLVNALKQKFYITQAKDLVVDVKQGVISFDYSKCVSVAKTLIGQCTNLFGGQTSGHIATKITTAGDSYGFCWTGKQEDGKCYGYVMNGSGSALSATNVLKQLELLGYTA